MVIVKEENTSNLTSVLKPTQLVNKLEGKVRGDIVVYHEGFIAMERAYSVELSKDFDRLYTFVCILDRAKIAFPYSKRLGDMKYIYGIKMLKKILRHNSLQYNALIKIAHEVDTKKDFDAAWFVGAKVNMLRC